MSPEAFGSRLDHTHPYGNAFKRRCLFFQKTIMDFAPRRQGRRESLASRADHLNIAGQSLEDVGNRVYAFWDGVGQGNSVAASFTEIDMEGKTIR